MKLAVCAAFIALGLAWVANADLPVTVPLPGNKKGSGDECVSWWCPMLLATNTNTTLLFGCCKTGERNKILAKMIASKDSGKTWSKQTIPPDLGQAVYSSKSSTIIMTIGEMRSCVPNAKLVTHRCTLTPTFRLLKRRAWSRPAIRTAPSPQCSRSIAITAQK